MSVIRKRHVVRCSKKNHVARCSKFRCPSLEFPLPVVMNFVAHGSVCPSPWFITSITMVYQADGRRFFARFDSTFKEREGDVGWWTERAESLTCSQPRATPWVIDE